MRTPSQYLFTYNTQANKILSDTDKYVEDIFVGVYIKNNGMKSLLLNFAQASINLNITNTKISNHVLDKIIVI